MLNENKNSAGTAGGSAGAVHGRLIIRTAAAADAEALLDIYAPYVTATAITFEYEVPSADEFRGRIERTLAGYPYLVAELNGTVAGYAYAGVFKDRAAYDRTAEMTVYVDKDMKGLGIGSALYGALERALFEQGILNAEACIGAPDGDEDEYLTFDSMRFHEFMGYRLVGEFKKCGYKFGRWYNMIWMEKLLGEHGASPAPVRPFSDIKHT